MNLNNRKIRGYEYFQNVFTAAAVVLCHRMGIAKMLAGELSIDKNNITADIAQHSQVYVNAVMDWLVIHGYIENHEKKYALTDKGITLFTHASLLDGLVKLYPKIVAVLKHASLDDFEKAEFSQEEVTTLTEMKVDGFPMLTVAAVSFLECMKIKLRRKSDKTSVKDILLQDGSVDIQSIQAFSTQNRRLFLNTLVDAGLLQTQDDEYYHLTESGKAVLPLSGYATLVMSYLIPLGEISALAQDKKYGLNQAVCRDTELNALASNGIIKIKVSPAIVDCLNTHDIFSKKRNRQTAFIDYGSGGGDMLMQVATAQSFNAEFLYGIDINPATVDTAEQIIASRGLSEKIRFETGSITDEECLYRVRQKLESKNATIGAASINFILHDIGPILSKSFLQAHASIFPECPLIITETLRIPLAILTQHPHYQAPTFQFMHDISSQSLYTESELKRLLEDSGYRIVHKKTHASIPSGEHGSRLPTIITWVACAS